VVGEEAASIEDEELEGKDWVFFLAFCDCCCLVDIPRVFEATRNPKGRFNETVAELRTHTNSAVTVTETELREWRFIFTI
jgi:hypothetical protein